MATTPSQGLRYPVGADNNDVPADMKNLADDVDAKLDTLDADVATNTADIATIEATLIQTGKEAETTDSNGARTVTFGTAFSSAPVVVATQSAAGSAEEYTVHVYNVTTTQVSFRFWKHVPHGEDPEVIRQNSAIVNWHWIAIGPG